MKAARARKTLALAAAAASVCLLLPAPAAAKLGRGDARKLIAALSIFELSSGAVEIGEISSTEAEATARALVKAAFRFARGEGGRWRAVEIRVGDRQWEDLDVLAAAAGAERIASARAALDALAAELEERARRRKRADKHSSGGPPAVSGSDDKASAGRESEGGVADDESPLVRGPVRVEKPASALSALGSSAVLEAAVEASFDFVRERGRWRVARARLGAEAVADFDALGRAVDQAKVARVRADFDALRAALDAFRNERGFFPVVDTSSALNDHLVPRYLAAPLRFDPWHRPYEYKGARDSFSLSSVGPDGRPNTADDVTVRK
jgi:hypothetical protein